MTKIIEEGGSALNGRAIHQSEVPKIVELVSSILTKIGLSENDFENSGSAGKKKDTETSGDIDFIINKKALASALGISDSTTRAVIDALKTYLNDNGYETNVSYGFNIVSFSLSVDGPEDNVQIDLNVVSSMEFARFFQSSPDYRKDESKYKALARNIFFMEIVGKIARRTTKRVTLENGFVGDGEVEQYTLRLNDGVFKTRRSWIGKRGKLVKTVNRLHDYDELIYDTPQTLIDALFVDTKPEELISFESLFNVFMSDKFKYPELREKILISTAMAFITQGNEEKGIVMPSEIEPRYIDKANDLIAKLEAEYLNNKDSKIVSTEEFEGLHIKSFKKFLNEEKENSITVTFKEVYMSHEVTRTCNNMSKEDVIALYALNSPDIEWYQFEGEEVVNNY